MLMGDAGGNRHAIGIKSFTISPLPIFKPLHSHIPSILSNALNVVARHFTKEINETL